VVAASLAMGRGVVQVSEKYSRHNGGVIGKILVRSRFTRYCDCCNHAINAGQFHVRLYGSSGCGETPYVLRECLSCRRVRGEVWDESTRKVIPKSTVPS